MEHKKTTTDGGGGDTVRRQLKLNRNTLELSRLKDLIEIRKDYDIYVNETAGGSAGVSVTGELLEGSVSSAQTGMTTVGAPSKSSMR